MTDDIGLGTQQARADHGAEWAELARCGVLGLTHGRRHLRIVGSGSETEPGLSLRSGSK